MTISLPPLPPTPPAAADPKLADVALRVMRHVCKGNGIKAERVTLKSFTGHMIKMAGTTYLEVRPVLREKTLPGKQVVGQLTAHRQGALGAIDQVIIAALKNGSTRRQFLELLLKRPDKGFAIAESTTLSADFLAQDFSWHETCRSCGGQGKTGCPKCNATGREVCSQCLGKTMIPCPLCRGAGLVTGQNGKSQPCSRCHGQRQIACPLCQRTGKVTCRQCRGSSFAQCTTCSGSGHFTQVIHMIPQIVTHYDYARADGPTDVLPLLDASANDLMQKGHIKISANPAQGDPNILAVEYDITFPHGGIVFMVGKQEIKGRLFGFKSRLLNLPPFLEKIIAPGIKDIESAASGQGSVAGKIKRASRYRILGYALLSAGQNTIKATTDMLMQKFPLGITKKTAEHIAKLSDSAVANITRKPRYIGLVIGLVMVSALYAFYYLGGGRNIISSYIPTPTLDIAMDIFIILLGGTLTTVCIQLSAANAMRTALGHLVSPATRRTLIPKTRGSGWWGYLGGVIIYSIMIELTLHVTNAMTPGWYVALRGMFF